jgi:formylglycine-generating enzyme required for sulfatase activity
VELDEKIRQAHARDLLDKGDAQSDDERALEQYEQARTYVSDIETTRKIRGASFRIWSRRAEKHQGGDWAQAGAGWARAAEFADESQREAAESSRKFCGTFANGVRARSNGDWAQALGLFKELARDPRGYADAIEKEIKRAGEALAMAAEAERDQVRKDFEALQAQARAARGRLAWAEAKAVLDRMNDPKFSSMSREKTADVLRDVEDALTAPPGMVYVPAGDFLMGDAGPRAREIEGPPCSVSVAAFYIDLRETTVGEYAEFLKALEGGGAQAGGPKDEPPGKSHVPDDWEAQKERPGDPVTGVDWWDAAGYAAWRKKRLPTEAEWEKAAGFDLQGRRAYPWGPEYRKEGGASFLGCEAMGGGVIEWTACWFDKYPGSPASHFEFGKKKKVLRGGVLLAEDSERDARVTHRKWYPPSYRSRRIGFRCVKDIREIKQEDR